MKLTKSQDLIVHDFRRFTKDERQNFAEKSSISKTLQNCASFLSKTQSFAFCPSRNCKNRNKRIYIFFKSTESFVSDDPCVYEPSSYEGRVDTISTNINISSYSDTFSAPSIIYGLLAQGQSHYYTTLVKYGCA